LIVLRFPKPLVQRDAIKEGHKYVHFRICIPSYATVFDDKIENENGVVKLSGIGFEFYVGKYEWNPLLRQYKGNNGMVARTLSNKIALEYRNADSPVLPITATPFPDYSAKPPPHLSGQSIYDCELSDHSSTIVEELASAYRHCTPSYHNSHQDSRMAEVEN
jgi:hypothetical protein